MDLKGLSAVDKGSSCWREGLMARGTGATVQGAIGVATASAAGGEDARSAQRSPNLPEPPPPSGPERRPPAPDLVHARGAEQDAPRPPPQSQPVAARATRAAVAAAVAAY